MIYKIKIMRVKAGLSQEELAMKAHVSRAIISLLEQDGAQVNTTTDTLLKIADALGCKVTDIFCP